MNPRVTLTCPCGHQSSAVTAQALKVAAADHSERKHQPRPSEPLLLLLDLEARGLQVSRDGDDLLVRPRGQLTDVDRAALRHWKAHVLALVDSTSAVQVETNTGQLVAAKGCDQCAGQGLDSGNAGRRCGQCGRVLGVVE